MLEIADVFREAGPAYRERFAARMLPSQLKAMRDIERCRTPALGGHLHQCDRCAHLLYSYHSCRNRHCPKCQGDHTQRWLDEQRLVLPPTPEADPHRVNVQPFGFSGGTRDEAEKMQIVSFRQECVTRGGPVS